MGKIITSKSPLRQIAPNDNNDQIIRKMNQNMTDLWIMYNDSLKRVEELENENTLIYIKKNSNFITIRTAQGNRNIILEEGS